LSLPGGVTTLASFSANPVTVMTETRVQERVVPIPDKIEMLEEHSDLVIRRTWFGYHLFFLFFFCIIWNGFLIFWYQMAFSATDTPLFVKLFPIGHVAVGLGLLYYVVAGFLNKTDIIISPETLKVRTYPVKWPGDKVIDVADVRQLYTTEKVTRTKNGQTVRYAVNIVTHANRKVKLVGGLMHKDQALYIEKNIEDVLGICDQSVAGEV